ncbi:ribosome recycling factor [Candidatus Cytomitobacter indipagum]|uniref:Ribosome recycling factor n=1 Tax=Candidatus Cytomitobacter indipagum TaxID=2601575 RepID=A0A5C0UGP6_9PROT|nr:ribosome recycling factor [Candidatus Cytomitobacter indipagum]QEK38204.1 ribosome recycling factor [Candidatus Cytomitobacter indipagum]
MTNHIESDLKNRMEKTIVALKSNLSGLRTNVVTPDFLSSIKVDSHGQIMPIKSVASITARNQALHVQVWDKSLIRSTEKSIRDSNLNVNPYVEGDSIVVKIPSLTQERRNEIVKVAKDFKEKAKISMRSTRQDIMSELKKMEKDKEISEDIRKKSEKSFDEIVKKYTAKVDEIVSQKEKEILN